MFEISINEIELNIEISWKKKSLDLFQLRLETLKVQSFPPSDVNPRMFTGWETKRKFWIYSGSFLGEDSSQLLLDELFVFQNFCLQGIILFLLVLDLLLQLLQFCFKRLQNPFSLPEERTNKNVITHKNFCFLCETEAAVLDSQNELFL